MTLGGGGEMLSGVKRFDNASIGPAAVKTRWRSRGHISTSFDIIQPSSFLTHDEPWPPRLSGKNYVPTGAD